MHIHWRRCVCLLVGLGVITTCRAAAPRHRWVYLSTNLQVADNVGVAEGILRRAKAAGYNGVVLSDYKLNRLDSVPPQYFDNARTFAKTAAALGFDVYPAVCPIGYSNGLLSHDPNLAEGLPVKDATFVVSGREADVVSTNLLSNGGFEAVHGDKLDDWTMQDAPGVVSFSDSSEHHGGARSIRMTNIGAGDPQAGHGRLMRTVPVKPFRQYHVSVWIKTKDYDSPGETRCTVLTAAGAELTFPGWSIAPTQDWTEYHAVFNSLANTSVNVYFGVWGGKHGSIWWDDARVEEVGFLNVLRRQGCPLTVKGEDGTPYSEGSDFDVVKDERMGTVPWPGEYEVYHTPPHLRLLRGSRIKDGQMLKVSFYHAVTIYGGQVCSCLSDPKVYTLLADQIRRVNDLFHPKGFLMSHDELRVANWCETCLKRKLTPGELLADNVKRCAAMIRKASPKAELYVWSDMFDPYHNARDKYYLVNGALLGSWRGLDKGVGYVNWNFDARAKNAAWINKRGNKQILAGYYDGKPESIKTWLNDIRGVSGVDGVMYTTWQNRYDDLEAFAKAAW
ncbi:MAG TPA: carbohydrate binding domain-containing protein [Armatimonadota bacterium]|jgi:hypothetical protein